METETCIAKLTKFKVINITRDLCDQIKADYVRAFSIFPKDEYHKQRQILMDKYHGLAWSAPLGYRFIANHGKDNQGRMQVFLLDDRIIEDPNGDQYLISESQYKRYFISDSDAAIFQQRLSKLISLMGKSDASAD